MAFDWPKIKNYVFWLDEKFYINNGFWLAEKFKIMASGWMKIQYDHGFCLDEKFDMINSVGQ